MKTAQLTLGLRLRDSSVLASFHPGRNQPTVDALAALRPGRGPTCVWLHGSIGTGKTHLLQAMCARAAQRAESAAYVPLSDVVDAGPELLFGYGSWQCVALDDAEKIAGHAGWERALFALHQELEETGGLLLVSGSAPPRSLGFRLRDLASRLSGGLVLTLHPLAEEEQVRALQLRAQLRGFELPEDTASFLLRRLPRDMTSLCEFLDELDQASLVAQRRLTVPFVREVLERRAAARDG